MTASTRAVEVPVPMASPAPPQTLLDMLAQASTAAGSARPAWIAAALETLPGHVCAVRGPIGAGKTFAIGLMVRVLRARGVSARAFAEEVNKQLLLRYLIDSPQHAFGFQVRMTSRAESRAELAAQAAVDGPRFAALERDRDENYHVFAVGQLLSGNMTPAQVWEVGQSSVSTSTANADGAHVTAALCLFAPASSCTERIVRRDRDGEADQYVAGPLRAYARRMHDTSYFRWPLIAWEYDQRIGTAPRALPVLCERYPSADALIAAATAACAASDNTGSLTYEVHADVGRDDAPLLAATDGAVDAARDKHGNLLPEYADAFERRWNGGNETVVAEPKMLRGGGDPDAVLAWDYYERALAEGRQRDADTFACLVLAHLIRGHYIVLVASRRYMCAQCLHRPRMCGVPFCKEDGDVESTSVVDAAQLKTVRSLACMLCQLCFERAVITERGFVL